MPKIKLKLSPTDARKLPAAAELAGAVVLDGFPVKDLYHVLVRCRTAEIIYDLGVSMSTITEKEVVAHAERQKAKEAARKAKATARL